MRGIKNGGNERKPPVKNGQWSIVLSRGESGISDSDDSVQYCTIYNN